MSQKRPTYQRTFSGLIGAMVICLVVVLGYVAFRAVNRDDLEVRPEPIAYLAATAFAQEAGTDVLYPAELPEGWQVTSLVDSPGDRPTWGMGMLTDNDAFAGFTWADKDRSQVLREVLDDEFEADEPDRTVEVETDLATQGWELWSEGRNLALTTELGDRVLVVHGSAGEARLVQLAEQLTDAPLAQ